MGTTVTPPSLGPLAGRPAERHSVAAALLFPLLEVVRHMGVPAEDVFAPLGLRGFDAAEPYARIPYDLHLAIIARARALTEEPAIGILWGLQMRATVFGHLGFATMSAATLRDALDIAVRFAPLMSTAEGLRLQVDGGVASLVLEEPEESAPVLDVITMTRLAGLWHLGETLTGRELSAVTEVSFPEPAYFARFRESAPPVRFGCPATRVLIDARLLDLPLVTADPVSLRLASEQCAREIAAVETTGRTVRDVRKQLWREDGSLRSPAEVARALHVSPRTLRRKLEGEGRSLSSLLDEERRDRATTLLRSPGLSLSQVAERLGYGKVQSFERAFRRWTGTTPAAYRKG